MKQEEQDSQKKDIHSDIYVAPKIEILEMEMEQNILVGSSGELPDYIPEAW